MGVPKKRKTKSATRQRRSHHGLPQIHLARCRQCGAAVLPHEACRECGYYPTRSSKLGVRSSVTKQTDKSKQVAPQKT